MSKARAKGTSFENTVLSYLRDIWPDVERAPLKGNYDYGDFINVDRWMIEARNRKTWSLKEWIRQAYKRVQLRHGDKHKGAWVIVFKDDMRGELDEPYAVLSLGMLIELMGGYYETEA